MSSSRRSSRRSKKSSVYSVNDLVQIPHNSSNVIGRLAQKLMEPPSARWLVCYDNIPSRKDEEIPEEALGPIIGKGDGSFTKGSKQTKETFIATRGSSRNAGRKRNSSSTAAESSNSNDSTEDESSSAVSIKKKDGKTSRESSDDKSAKPISKPIPRTPSPKQKIKNGRDKRTSRRRRGLSNDDALLPVDVTNNDAAVASNAAGGRRKASEGSPNYTPKKKRSASDETSNASSRNNAKGGCEFKNSNKKVKSEDVSKPLKVVFSTGTLYLSKQKVVWTFTR